MKYYGIALPPVLAFVRSFVVVAAVVVGFAPQSLRAQSFDRIERERALTMLSNVKDQLKKHYYDPSMPRMVGS